MFCCFFRLLLGDSPREGVAPAPAPTGVSTGVTEVYLITKITHTKYVTSKKSRELSTKFE